MLRFITGNGLFDCGGWLSKSEIHRAGRGGNPAMVKVSPPPWAKAVVLRQPGRRGPEQDGTPPHTPKLPSAGVISSLSL